MFGCKCDKSVTNNFTTLPPLRVPPLLRYLERETIPPKKTSIHKHSEQP